LSRAKYLTIRAVLRKAPDEWEWIEKAPKIKLYREPKRPVPWITPKQATALLAELSEHQRDMVLFALATGLRQGKVTGLCWSQLDPARPTAWVHGEDARNGDDLHVWLNNLAMDVLQRQRGKHREYVFTYRGSRSAGLTRRYGGLRCPAARAVPIAALPSLSARGFLL
jgi:integrase